MKKRAIGAIVVACLALGGGATYAVALKKPSHAELASRLKSVCGNEFAKASGTAIGVGTTVALGSDDSGYAEAADYAMAARDKVDAIADDAGGDDADRLTSISDYVNDATTALVDREPENAARAGYKASSAISEGFSVDCPNLGGSEEAAKSAASAPLAAACDRYRPLLADAGDGLGDIADVSDAAGARSIALIASRSKRFATAVDDADVEGTDEMVDALQEASRVFLTASNDWRASYYTDANDSISEGLESLYRALDEGESLGVASCSREP